MEGPMEDNVQLRRGLARLIVSSWRSDHYKHQAVVDPAGTLAAQGVDVPAGVTIHIVEDSEKTRHVILGDKPLDESKVVSQLADTPDFYEAYAYAYELARTNPWFKLYLLRHPTETFLRLGVKLPVDAEIVVHENTGVVRTFAIPQRPAQLASSAGLAQAASSTLTAVNANANVNANVQANVNADVNVNAVLQVNAAAAVAVIVAVLI